MGHGTVPKGSFELDLAHHDPTAFAHWVTRGRVSFGPAFRTLTHVAGPPGKCARPSAADAEGSAQAPYVHYEYHCGEPRLDGLCPAWLQGIWAGGEVNETTGLVMDRYLQPRVNLTDGLTTMGGGNMSIYGRIYADQLASTDLEVLKRMYYLDPYGPSLEPIFKALTGNTSRTVANISCGTVAVDALGETFEMDIQYQTPKAVAGWKTRGVVRRIAKNGTVEFVLAEPGACLRPLDATGKVVYPTAASAAAAGALAKASTDTVGFPSSVTSMFSHAIYHCATELVRLECPAWLRGAFSGQTRDAAGKLTGEHWNLTVVGDVAHMTEPNGRVVRSKVRCGAPTMISPGGRVVPRWLFATPQEDRIKSLHIDFLHDAPAELVHWVMRGVVRFRPTNGQLELAVSPHGWCSRPRGVALTALESPFSRIEFACAQPPRLPHACPPWVRGHWRSPGAIAVAEQGAYVWESDGLGFAVTDTGLHHPNTTLDLVEEDNSVVRTWTYNGSRYRYRTALSCSASSVAALTTAQAYRGVAPYRIPADAFLNKLVDVNHVVTWDVSAASLNDAFPHPPPNNLTGWVERGIMSYTDLAGSFTMVRSERNYCGRPIALDGARRRPYVRRDFNCSTPVLNGTCPRWLQGRWRGHVLNSSSGASIVAGSGDWTFHANSSVLLREGGAELTGLAFCRLRPNATQGPTMEEVYEMDITYHGGASASHAFPGWVERALVKRSTLQESVTLQRAAGAAGGAIGWATAPEIYPRDAVPRARYEDGNNTITILAGGPGLCSRPKGFTLPVATHLVARTARRMQVAAVPIDTVVSTVPENFTVSAFEARTSLLVGWASPRKDNYAEVTRYRVEWVPSPGFAPFDAATKGAATPQWTDVPGLGRGPFSGGTFRYQIRGLLPGIAYHVRIAAINEMGRGPYIGTVPISETPRAAPRPPGVVTAHKVYPTGGETIETSETSLRVSYRTTRIDTTGQYAHGGNVTHHMIEWDTTPTFDRGLHSNGTRVVRVREVGLEVQAQRSPCTYFNVSRRYMGTAADPTRPPALEWNFDDKTLKVSNELSVALGGGRGAPHTVVTAHTCGGVAFATPLPHGGGGFGQWSVAFSSKATGVANDATGAAGACAALEKPLLDATVEVGKAGAPVCPTKATNADPSPVHYPLNYLAVPGKLLNNLPGGGGSGSISLWAWALAGDNLCSHLIALGGDAPGGVGHRATVSVTGGALSPIATLRATMGKSRTVVAVLNVSRADLERGGVHVMFAWWGGSQKAALYVNGTRVGTGTDADGLGLSPSSASSAASPVQELRIGANWRGRLDNLYLRAGRISLREAQWAAAHQGASMPTTAPACADVSTRFSSNHSINLDSPLLALLPLEGAGRCCRGGASSSCASGVCDSEDGSRRCRLGAAPTNVDMCSGSRCVAGGNGGCPFDVSTAGSPCNAAFLSACAVSLPPVDPLGEPVIPAARANCPLVPGANASNATVVRRMMPCVDALSTLRATLDAAGTTSVACTALVQALVVYLKNPTGAASLTGLRTAVSGGTCGHSCVGDVGAALRTYATGTTCAAVTADKVNADEADVVWLAGPVVAASAAETMEDLVCAWRWQPGHGRGGGGVGTPLAAAPRTQMCLEVLSGSLASFAARSLSCRTLRDAGCCWPTAERLLRLALPTMEGTHAHHEERIETRGEASRRVTKRNVVSSSLPAEYLATVAFLREICPAHWVSGIDCRASTAADNVSAAVPLNPSTGGRWRTTARGDSLPLLCPQHVHDYCTAVNPTDPGCSRADVRRVVSRPDAAPFGSSVVPLISAARDTVANQSTADVRSFLIRNLTHRLPYYVRVSAVNDAGIGVAKWSTALRVSPALIPSPPKTVGVDLVRYGTRRDYATSLHVEFLPSYRDRSLVTAFLVEWRLVESRASDLKVGTTKVGLCPLKMESREGVAGGAAAATATTKVNKTRQLLNATNGSENAPNATNNSNVTLLGQKWGEFPGILANRSAAHWGHRGTNKGNAFVFGDVRSSVASAGISATPLGGDGTTVDLKVAGGANAVFAGGAPASWNWDTMEEWGHARITGLVPGARYEVRVKAKIDAFGYATVSAPKTITTPLIPPNPVRSVSATHVDGTSLKVSFFETDFDGGSPVHTYLIELDSATTFICDASTGLVGKVTGDYRATFFKAPSGVGGGAGNALSFVIKGLDMGLYYYARVTAINEAGQGLVSSPLAKGKPMQPPSGVSFASLSVKDSTSLELGFNEPPVACPLDRPVFDSGGDRIHTYEVELGTTSTFSKAVDTVFQRSFAMREGVGAGGLDLFKLVVNSDIIPAAAFCGKSPPGSDYGGLPGASGTAAGGQFGACCNGDADCVPQPSGAAGVCNMALRSCTVACASDTDCYGLTATATAVPVLLAAGKTLQCNVGTCAGGCPFNRTVPENPCDSQGTPCQPSAFASGWVHGHKTGGTASASCSLAIRTYCSLLNPRDPACKLDAVRFAGRTAFPRCPDRAPRFPDNTTRAVLKIGGGAARGCCLWTRANSMPASRRATAQVAVYGLYPRRPRCCHGTRYCWSRL